MRVVVRWDIVVSRQPIRDSARKKWLLTQPPFFFGAKTGKAQHAPWGHVILFFQRSSNEKKKWHNMHTDCGYMWTGRGRVATCQSTRKGPHLFVLPFFAG